MLLRDWRAMPIAAVSVMAGFAGQRFKVAGSPATRSASSQGHSG